MQKRADGLLGKTMDQYREAILGALKRRFAEMEAEPYRNLMLDTPEGKHRLQYWTDLAINASLGHPDLFFRDQSQIGFKRARQGFALSDAANVHKFYILSVLEVLLQQEEVRKPQEQKLLQDMQVMIDIALDGLRLLAQSFIATREEIIAEKVQLLQRLYRFTQTVMGSLNQDEILRITRKELKSIFGVACCSLSAISKGDENWKHYNGNRQLKREWLKLINDSWAKNRERFTTLDGNIQNGCENLDKIGSAVILMRGYERRHGVLLLNNELDGFPFSQEDLDLVKQFLYIAAMVLENSQMVNQIKTHSSRLRLLAMRTLDVSELERKKISEEIHDTLTQTMTGISYKLQFCQEIGCADSVTLQNELSGLVSTVRQAIGQSRDLITSLHPDIIDNIGLVPALQKLLFNYKAKNTINIDFSFDEEIDLPPKMTNALYRIFQEALVNIRKHANASKINGFLTVQDDTVQLVIVDNGSGLSTHDTIPIMPEKGRFGLFYMQQRVEMLGGSIHLMTPHNGGCMLEVRIPLK